MKKSIIVLCFICCITLFGCSSTYERDSQPGEIKQISLLEMEEKMKLDESFVVMLTQSRCIYCQDFEAVLKEYTKDHRVIVYDVILDQEPRSQDENLDIIERYFEGFSSTPGIFYVNEGTSISQLKGEKEGISKDLFDNWVIKHKIDKVEQ